MLCPEICWQEYFWDGKYILTLQFMPHKFTIIGENVKVEIFLYNIPVHKPCTVQCAGWWCNFQKHNYTKYSSKCLCREDL